MAVHASGVLLILCVFYAVFPLKSLFSWHPLLVVVGLFGFSLQGIIVYNKHSSLVTDSPPLRKSSLHWVLQVLGICLISAGCAVIYKVKSDNNKRHMTSWHGYLGYIFLIYGLTQVLFGFLKSRSFVRSWIKPRTSRLLHASSGAVYFTLGCFVATLGFRSDWFQQNAFVHAIHDQRGLLLSNYILISLIGLLAIVTLKQIYDRHFAGAEATKNTKQNISKTKNRAK